MAKFTLLFKAPSPWFVLYKDETYAGTALIENLAKEAGVDPESIDNWAPARGEQSIVIELGLAKAREIPPLRDRGLVKIVVPKNFLDRFAVLRLVEDEGRNGEPYRLQWEINEESLLEAWASAGFPTEWFVPQDE